MLSNANLMGSEKLLWKYQMYSPSVPWKYFYMHKYDDATLLIAYLTSIIRLVNILVISGQNFPWHIKDAMVHTEIIFTRFYINLQTSSDSNIIFFFFLKTVQVGMRYGGSMHSQTELDSWGPVLVSSGHCNKIPQTGGLNNRHLFLPVLEAGSPKSRWFRSWWRLSPWLADGTFSLCPHRSLGLSLLIRTLFYHRIYTVMNLSNPNSLPKASLSKDHHVGDFDISVMGRAQNSVHGRT